MPRPGSTQPRTQGNFRHGAVQKCLDTAEPATAPAMPITTCPQRLNWGEPTPRIKSRNATTRRRVLAMAAKTSDVEKRAVGATIDPLTTKARGPTNPLTHIVDHRDSTKSAGLYFVLERSQPRSHHRGAPRLWRFSSKWTNCSALWRRVVNDDFSSHSSNDCFCRSHGLGVWMIRCVPGARCRA